MDKNVGKMCRDKRFVFIGSGTHSLLPYDDDVMNLVFMNGPEAVTFTHGDNAFKIEPYSIVLAGRGMEASVTIPDKGHGVVVFFACVCQCCEMLICAYLEHNDVSYSGSCNSIPMNDHLKCFFNTMDEDLSTLYDEKSFQNMKFLELSHLLCRWLDISDLVKFFYPALSCHDPAFRKMVLENFGRSYRVKSLAAECGYTEKQFVEKFKEEFGEMPKTWIANQQLKFIQERLSDREISFKEIADELLMSSVQSLSRFCKNHTGMTPSALRAAIVRE